MYHVSPFEHGSRAVPFSFDWSIDYYPTEYSRPGPEMSVYRLTDGRCGAATQRSSRRAVGGSHILSGSDDRHHRYRPPPPRPRDRDRRAGPRPREPQPDGRAPCSADGDGVIGEGFHGELGGPARRGRGDPRRRRPRRWPTPPCTSRWSPAAIRGARRRAPTRSARRGSRASSSAPTIPSEHASGRGPGHPARRGRRDRARQRRSGRPGAAAQPAVSQARAHRPPVGAVQVRDDAGRQGRHPQRRLEVDLRRVQPPPRASLARRVRRGRGRRRDRAGRRSAAHRAGRERRRASPAGSCSTRWPACRWTPSWSATRAGAADVVVSRAAPRAATDALEAHGADVIVATGENEPARVCSALDQLGAAGIASILLEGGPHLAGAFLDAKRDRRDPPVPGPADPRRAHRPRSAGGRGRGADRRRCARAHTGVRAGRGGSARLRPAHASGRGDQPSSPD